MEVTQLEKARFGHTINKINKQNYLIFGGAVKNRDS